MESRLRIVLTLLPLTTALIASDISRGRLSEALSSPSGKLTFSPEIIIPDPNDPTAMLLQTNAVQTLSNRIRSCKANTAFIHSSVDSLRTFANEQEEYRGSFPGPVPIVFCPRNNDDNEQTEFDKISEMGVEGVLIRVNNGNAIQDLQDILGDDQFASQCKAAASCGLQPIPEVTLSDAVTSGWDDEKDADSLIENIAKATGADPVSIVLSMCPSSSEDSEEPVTLPEIPTDAGDRVPFLGMVRVTAGEGRIGAEAARFKEHGFAGTVLCNDCLPGDGTQKLDMEITGIFWSNAINDLKSTKSKTFSFRSKNNMEKSQATIWGNYRKDIVESGALGDPNEMASINEDNGDYQGF